MSRAVTVVLCTLALCATGFSAAPAATPPTVSPAVDLSVPGPGVLISENVDYVATIPLDSPGVGGKFRTVDGVPYYFVTGEKGLSIYDVTDPGLPLLVSVTPFPHSQNEDLSVADDGSRVVISADGGLPIPVLINQGVHVFDTSDLAAPVKLASLSGSAHTTECADPACEWLYTSNGTILDATFANGPTIVEVGRWNLDRAGEAVGGRHALHRDEAGLVISDSSPRLVLDPRPHVGADGTEYGYARPELLALGSRRDTVDNRLQHNNDRPNALTWEPRDPADPADAYDEPVVPEDGGTFTLPEGSLRDGEILIANSESNINPTCSMSGALSTWDVRDHDRGRAPVQLDVFHPAAGTWADGSPALAASGCSGHWFDVAGPYVAASWYEHGVHIFEVGLDTGAITEIGFFQPVTTIAGQSQWHVDEEGTMWIYSADYARGIDILRFDPEAPRPSDDERLAAWFAGAEAAAAGAGRTLQTWCELAARER
jgi:hypothetical protein